LIKFTEQEDLNQKDFELFSKEKELLLNKLKSLGPKKLSQENLKEYGKKIKIIDSFIDKILTSRKNLKEST